MLDKDRSTSPLNLSRRNFIRMAVGSLVWLSPVAGGGYLLPTTAYAATTASDEQDGGDKRDLPEVAKVTVVTYAQIGLVVLDMSEGGETPVIGASIKVTSRATKKTLEDTTDDEGKVIFNIKELAENPDNEDIDKLGEYAFNGTVEVACDGYRTFKSALMRLEGTACIAIPTRKIGDGAESAPYPHMVALDEWDVLYTQNSFLTTAANTDSHNFDIVLKNAGSQTGTVQLCEVDSGKVLASSEATPDSEGTISVTLQSPFLALGGDNAFEKDKQYEVVYTPEGSEDSYAWSVQANVDEGITNEPVQDDNVELKPFNTTTKSGTSTVFDVSWPDWVPMLGGTKIKFLTDLQFPLSVYVNPFGYVQISGTLPSWGYKDDTGKEQPGEWKSYPYDSVKNQWQKGKDAFDQNFAKSLDCLENNRALNQVDLFASISATVCLQFMAALQWDVEKGYFQGEAGAQFIFKLSAMVTENFFVGVFPILITFGVDFSCIVAITVGMYSTEINPKNSTNLLPTEALNPEYWHLDLSNCGCVVTISLSPFLSAGVGVRGVASITVMGKVTITVVVAFTDTGGNPFPHTFGGCSAIITLNLAAFLFSVSVTIKEYPYEELFNNWDDSVQASALNSVNPDSALRNMKLSDISEGMTIITENQLQTTSEFEAEIDDDSLASQALSADGEPFSLSALSMEDTLAPLSDGTNIRYERRYFPSAKKYLAALKAQEDLQAAAMNETSDGTAAVAEATASSDATPAAEVAAVAQDDSTLAEEGAAAATLVAQATDETPSADDALTAQVGEELPAEADTQNQAEMGTQTQADAEAIMPTETEEAQATADVETASSQEETDLVAQANEVEPQANEGQPDLRALAIPRRSTKPSVKYSYKRVGKLSAGLSRQPNTISGLGDQGGVVPTPSSDKMIGENVFGDPRLKVVSIETNLGDMGIHATCCFRIGSVTIKTREGDLVRSRVIMTVLDASTIADEGKPAESLPEYIGMRKVMEFDIDELQNVSHNDLFDYDFGLTLASYDLSISSTTTTFDEVHLVIVSGKRPGGDDSKYADVATNLYFTHLRMDASDVLGGDLQYFKVTMPANQIIQDDKFHNISCINLVAETSEDQDACAVLVSYLDRSANNADDVLSEDASKVTVRPCFEFVDCVDDEMRTPDASDIDKLVGEISDATIFRLTLSPRIGGHFTLTLRSYTTSYFFLLDFDTDDVKFTRFTRCSVLDTSLNLVPWTQQDCFLTSYPKADYVPQLSQLDPNDWDRTQWVLQKASWDASAATPTLQFTPIGPDSFNFSNFALNSSGTFITWPEHRTGDDSRVYDAEGNYELNHSGKDGDTGEAYHLMACRIRQSETTGEYHFSDPFIAADVEHEMNSPEIMASHNRYAPFEVVSSQHIESETETDKNGEPMIYASNIWYTSVPNIPIATAIGAAGALPIVPAGGWAKFDIEIRNDGNSFINACMVQMYVHTKDGDNETVEAVPDTEQRLEFSAETIRPSAYNEYKDGAYTNVEDDFALAPGKISVYRVVVPIPADWAGETYVSFHAWDAEIAPGGGLVAFADDDAPIHAEPYAIEPGKFKVHRHRSSLDQDKEQTYMHVLTVRGFKRNHTPLGDAPLDVRKAKPRNSNPGQKEDKKQQLPNTGDVTLGSVPAGLALAGAALAAYGKRRQDVERGEAEKE